MSMQRKTCLIVGAAGFLGGYLSAACRADGYGVIGVSHQAPADPQQWDGFVQGELQDTDLAGWLGDRDLQACFILSGGASVSDSIAQPSRDFSLLLPGIAKLLEYLIHGHRNCHVVLFSSAAVYGNPQSIPIAEDAAIAPLSPYGVHKWMAEEMLRQYARIYGLHVSVLRIFSAYGSGLRRQIFWDLFRNYEAAVEKGTHTVMLSGTGTESRDFIHAADVAQAAVLIMQNEPEDNCQVYNVANGTGVLIRDAASMLLSRLRHKIDLRFSGTKRLGDPLHWKADIRKLQLIGYRESINLEQGLQRYADWIHHIGKDPQ